MSSRKRSFDEIELGLDPSKYSKKTFNPWNFKDYSEKSEIKTPAATPLPVGKEAYNPWQMAVESAQAKAAMQPADEFNQGDWAAIQNNDLKNKAIEYVRQGFNKEYIENTMLDAAHASWGDDPSEELVPPDVQAKLFDDWIEEDKVKRGGRADDNKIPMMQKGN